MLRASGLLARDNFRFARDPGIVAKPLKARLATSPDSYARLQIRYSRVFQMKLLAICSAALTLALAAITAVAQVTTSQYDNLRTGATLDESLLTPENVNVKRFGRLGAF